MVVYNDFTGLYAGLLNQEFEFVNRFCNLPVIFQNGI